MWTKLPAVKGSIACVTCNSGAKSDIGMDRHIAVGFGSAGYSKDGTVLWDENMPTSRDLDWDEIPTVRDVESLAMADPDHDWRIYFFAPMYEAEYQRQELCVWVLIKNGDGFA